MELTPFNFGTRPVRAGLRANGEPWFVHSDVCRALEHSNPSMALRLLEPDEQRTLSRPEALRFIEGIDPRVQSLTLINESGLYTLILRSNAPKAREFRRWVTSEVLPAIRRDGGYEMPEPRYEIPSTYADALELAARQARELEAARPAVEFLETFVSGEGTYLMREVAAVLKVKGMGQNNLYKFLRDQDVLMSGGDSHNLPKRRHIDLGRFEVKVGTRPDGEGGDVVTRTVRVTGKGMDYIRSLLSAHGYDAMATVNA